MRSGISIIPGAALLFLSVLWLGLLLGVSFLATPVKFQAQSLTLPVALDVGQVTFALFSKVEWALAALTAGCLFVAKPGKTQAMTIFVLLAIVAAQTFWLLPVLDGRLEAVVAGSPPPSSNHHVVYIAAETAKALLLLALALTSFRSMGAEVQKSPAAATKVPGQS